MTRFIQQQTPPMTERSFNQAPCPFCPTKTASILSEDDGKEKKKAVGKSKANKK